MMIFFFQLILYSINTQGEFQKIRKGKGFTELWSFDEFKRLQDDS